MRARWIWCVLVCLCLSSIAATESRAYNATEYFGYLKSLYNQHDKKLSDFLLGELKVFERQFPTAEEIPEASFLGAQIQRDRGNKQAAFGQYLKIVYLYPRSSVYDRAVEEVHRMLAMEKSLAEKATDIRAVFDSDLTGGEHVDRFYAYLAFLQKVAMEKMNEWALRQLQEFTIIYPDDDRAEQVQRWLAETYTASHKYNEAVASLLKYESLYPGEDRLPYVKYHRAFLLGEQMRDYDGALSLYAEVIAGYPESKYAGESLFAQAQLKADKKKDYLGAIKDYRQLATDMPQHEKAIPALMAIAQLEADKRREYDTALAVYDDIVVQYPGHDRSVEALLAAGELCNKKLKNYAQAAARYAQVATLFPEHAEAPEALLEAGAICENRLKDFIQAIAYYESVTELYPGTDYSRRADDKVVKLKRKMGS